MVYGIGNVLEIEFGINMEYFVILIF